MPPRRPGGKYKGSVGRAKGEATLQKEAELARQQALQDHLRRMEEKRQAELLASHGLKSTKEEEEETKRQRVMNLLMGGKKGNVKKMFKNWITGVQMLKRERMIANRDRAWRKSCGCLDEACPGGCTSFQRLDTVSFEMPSETSMRTGRSFCTTTKEALWPPPPPPLRSSLRRSLSALASTVLTPVPASGAAARGEALRLGASTGGTLQKTKSAVTFDVATLGPSPASSVAHVPGSRWACRCAACTGGSNAPPLPDPAKAVPAVHHKTGRRVLLDYEHMSIRFADSTRPHSLWHLQSPSSPTATM